MKAKLHVVGRVPRETVDLERLARMGTAELRVLYRDLFGAEVPAGNSELARRKIAWRLQSEREGALPESARQHALAMAKESAVRVRAISRAALEGKPLAHSSVTRIVSDHDSRVPMPGSVIVKEYHGRTILVRVLGEGFDYDGQRFSSLSAIAKSITGTKWNGMLFFGLAKGERRGR
jgi:Protein of unknown function (DUF2924)